MTDKMTTPKADNIVQKYAFPVDTTGFMLKECRMKMLAKKEVTSVSSRGVKSMQACWCRDRFQYLEKSATETMQRRYRRCD
uniref:Uncharacterized protein n=1 Tax=Candidozyma auris TaxID=498019 RepID=A0A0L0NS09_CANAR